MPDPKPWGPNDPNSAHQLWSRWRFHIRAAPDRLPSRDEVRRAIDDYARQVLKSSVGRARLDIPRAHPRNYRITIEIEGPPAHDAMYRDAIERHFRDRFVRGGFGLRARLVSMRVSILAGDTQDGRPRAQLIVLPRLALPSSVREDPPNG